MKKYFLVVLSLMALGISVIPSRADQYASNPEAYLYKNFADRLLLKGKRDQALLAYMWASCLDPGYGNAHYNRAIVLNEMGDFQEAREALGHYLALCPKDVNALYNKGVLSLYLGDLDTAGECLKQALCHCADPALSSSIHKAIGFVDSYRDCFVCCDKKGQKKLRHELLALVLSR